VRYIIYEEVLLDHIIRIDQYWDQNPVKRLIDAFSDLKPEILRWIA